MFVFVDLILNEDKSIPCWILFISREPGFKRGFAEALDSPFSWSTSDDRRAKHLGSAFVVAPTRYPLWDFQFPSCLVNTVVKSHRINGSLSPDTSNNCPTPTSRIWPRQCQKGSFCTLHIWHQSDLAIHWPILKRRSAEYYHSLLVWTFN